MPIFLKVNHQLESRMPEIGPSGSEGGAKISFVPTPMRKKKRSVPEGQDDCVGAAVDSITEPSTRQHESYRHIGQATGLGHCRDGITSALCGIRGALIMRFA